MKVELLAYTPNPEEVIEKCGRTCYKSPEKDAQHRAQFIKGIVKAGHTAVIEHATATFRISEVSRALTHQLVRHRLFSFCQQSQRYVKEEPLSSQVEGTQYFIPDVLQQKKFNNEKDEADMAAAKAIYDECMNACWIAYSKLIDIGIKKEDARYVLPNAAYTEICVTGNFREWHSFLELRCDVHAQLEIRQLAYAILQELLKIAPSVFEDIYEKFAAKQSFATMVDRTLSMLKDLNKPLTAEQREEINTKISADTQFDINTVFNNDFDEHVITTPYTTNAIDKDTCRQMYAKILDEQKNLTNQHLKSIQEISCVDSVPAK